MSKMEPLRILVADDHPVFRTGIKALLQATPAMELVGEATTGDSAVELATQLQPDVVLMDIKMPGLNGIEATRQIVHISPQIRVLVVTMFEDDASVFTALRAGARGYVLKDIDQDDLIHAIQAVGRGEAIFSAAIATRLIHYFAAPQVVVPRDLFPTLTDREREILVLIAQSYTNAEIGRQLMLSPKTVSNYVSNILGKLQVADRAQAILRARDAGLV